MKLFAGVFLCLLVVTVWSDNIFDDAIAGVLDGLKIDELAEKFGADEAMEKYGIDKLIEAFGFPEVSRVFGIKEDPTKTSKKPADGNPKPGEGSDNGNSGQEQGSDSENPGQEQPEKPLEEMVTKKTDIQAVIQLFGSRLNVWKHDNKFYVTPLGIFDTTTVHCAKDYDDSRYIFYFDIHVWSNDASSKTEAILADRDFIVDGIDILPLPMMEVRASIHPDLPPKIQVDTRWRVNENQPDVIKFSLYTEDEALCNQMVQEAKLTPNSFLGKTKLYFEFRMSINSENKQVVEVWTTEKDQSLPPPQSTGKVCDEQRIAALLTLINAGTADFITKQAWIKELADLMAICQAQA